MPTMGAVMPQLAAQAILLHQQPRIARHGADPIEVHADRGRDDIRPSRPPTRTTPSLISRRSSSRTRGQEIPAIALELEGDQVIGEQSLEQLAAPRAHAQLIGMRPGNVPEDRGARRGLQRAQVSRDQREMVVLDEDRRRGILEVAGDGLGEAAIHGLVGRPVFRAKHRLHVDHVTERPEALVREAAVVPALLFLAQPDPMQIVGGIFRRHAHTIARIADLPIGIAGAVRDPRAAALAHQRVERHGDTSGRGNSRDGSVLSRFVEIRLPVGNNNEHGRILEQSRCQIV